MRDTGEKSSVPSHLPYVTATVAEVTIVLKALLKLYKLMLKTKWERGIVNYNQPLVP